MNDANDMLRVLWLWTWRTDWTVNFALWVVNPAESAPVSHCGYDVLAQATKEGRSRQHSRHPRISPLDRRNHFFPRR